MPVNTTLTSQWLGIHPKKQEVLYLYAICPVPLPLLLLLLGTWSVSLQPLLFKTKLLISCLDIIQKLCLIKQRLQLYTPGPQQQQGNRNIAYG